MVRHWITPSQKQCGQPAGDLSFPLNFHRAFVGKRISIPHRQSSGDVPVYGLWVVKWGLEIFATLKSLLASKSIFCYLVFDVEKLV